MSQYVYMARPQLGSSDVTQVYEFLFRYIRYCMFGIFVPYEYCHIFPWVQQEVYMDVTMRMRTTVLLWPHEYMQP